MVFIIFAVNIVFIAFPYAVKNNNLILEIRRTQASISKLVSAKPNIDYYKTLKNFKSALDLSGLKASQTAEYDSNALVITLELNCSKSDFFKFLELLDKKAPGYIITDAELDFSSENLSTLTFNWK